MYLLFFDQAQNCTGFALFSCEKELIKYGVIDLSKTKQDQVNKRRILIEKISELICKYEIKMVSLEGIYKNNVKVYKILAKVQGSIEDLCCSKNIICFEYENPFEWLKKLGLKPKDRDYNKAKAKEYVLNALPYLSNDLSSDEYDAIGMGLAYFKMFE
jgi:Holliday junction resolvasome RuvABC endonuclease subunit